MIQLACFVVASLTAVVMAPKVQSLDGQLVTCGSLTNRDLTGSMSIAPREMARTWSRMVKGHGAVPARQAALADHGVRPTVIGMPPGVPNMSVRMFSMVHRLGHLVLLMDGEKPRTVRVGWARDGAER